MSMHDSYAASSGAVVDLVIPARDEQANIGPLFDALDRGFFRHVVVADNGSTDATAGCVRQRGAVVVGEPRPGYGGACLAALAWVADQLAPDMVAFLDADLSDDPAELPRLCQPIIDGEADLVIGSRLRLAEGGALNATQRFGNWLACAMIRVLTGRRYTDLGPMRVVRYESLQRLQMADRTWGWTVEMQYKAAVVGLRTLELDVPYRRRRSERSKISGSIIGSVRAGYVIIVTILRLWRWYRPQGATARTDGRG